tara:strand:- start:5707 stop:6528 length:822 start_codon:yes stop_codon:yes gene_type:complete
MYKIFHKVDKVFVINLEEEINRKKHFIKELDERNIPFERVNAVTCEDQEVKNLYRTNSVKSYPPCFRCKENECDHENNYLAPKQCANFLSFKKIMEKIVRNEIQTTIIFEDDLSFLSHSKKSFEHLNKFITKNKLLQANYPFLFKIGTHTIVKKRYFYKFYFLNKSTFIEDNHEHMSNPCFMINLEFAKHFLLNFRGIESTSDDFIHRTLVKEAGIKSFSIYPFPVTQLSHGVENIKFESSINPRKIGQNFVSKNKVSSKSEYDSLLKAWLKN